MIRAFDSRARAGTSYHPLTVGVTARGGPKGFSGYPPYEFAGQTRNFQAMLGGEDSHSSCVQMCWVRALNFATLARENFFAHWLRGVIRSLERKSPHSSGGLGIIHARLTFENGMRISQPVQWMADCRTKLMFGEEVLETEGPNGLSVHKSLEHYTGLIPVRQYSSKEGPRPGLESGDCSEL
ncbi:hypothetical protein CROQUDRAFT_94526 [Cronartium quercuum f. sp. fusiforme G11]|uniref:Uncharacterized protein n=1 Tax=Cronartium quercuum f. sp. fusiforme G11 TaxID=708437 RepID=A0A9P6NF82_9BASI|nr:hypothetical protein CROQUDRAFT_94526 [Cronartium quercuum f. sp. fusiforme G11]